jgi:hypothetical protein
MSDFEFGPVELILAAYADDEPDPAIIEAVLSLANAGTIRLLDLVVVSRTLTGELDFLELDETSIEIGEIELPASGLAGHEDAETLADRLPPGTSALLLVVELTFARHLASTLADANGFVVDSVRIPASVVNEVAAAARAAG